MRNPFSQKDTGGGSVSGYVQTQPIFNSGAVNIPSGTKRIEALLVGGGGGGSGSGGGGFGGIVIFEIPITGYSLDIVIGAGGSGGTGLIGGRGGTTTVGSAGTIYAAVGGGGSASNGNYTVGAGRFSGCAGGTASGQLCCPGGAPFPGKIVSCPLELLPSTGMAAGMGYSTAGANAALVYRGPGQGGFTTESVQGVNPTSGWGSGASSSGASNPAGAGAGYSSLNPGAGGGGMYSTAVPGGSLTDLKIWGFTGYAGGAGAGGTNGGGGGGGVFGVGANYSTYYGGVGGLGGGGGGAGYSAGYAGGAGGAGAVVLRLYS